MSDPILKPHLSKAICKICQKPVSDPVQWPPSKANGILVCQVCFAEFSKFFTETGGPVASQSLSLSVPAHSPPGSKLN